MTNMDTFICNPSLQQFYTYAPVALSAGKPVILGYVKPTGRTHYVLITALYGNGTDLSQYGCIDPYDGTYKNLVTVAGGRPLYRMAIYKRGLH